MAQPCGDDARYALLRLEIASVVVADPTAAEAVGVAELLAARPDPFREIESTLLWYLDTAHNDGPAGVPAAGTAASRPGPSPGVGPAGTASGSASKPTTPTATSGCPSISRCTTFPG